MSAVGDTGATKEHKGKERFKQTNERNSNFIISLRVSYKVYPK
jgi:hypothetical protein